MTHRRLTLLTLSIAALAACGDPSPGVAPDAGPPADAATAPRSDAADDPLCPPGVTQSWCPGPALVVQCSPDGAAWEEVPCPAGTSCYAGACVDWPCVPGTVTCGDPDTVVACLGDGDAYQWSPIETCGAGLCDDGICVASCGFDLKSLSGKPCEHFVLDLTGSADDACTDPGVLVVPSSGDDRLAVFDLSADPPAPLEGSPFATCDDPSRLAVDRAARILATCRGDGRVVAHTLGGEILWDTQLPSCGAARGIAIAGDGRVFAGCYSTGQVHELDPDDGAVLRSVLTGVDVYGLALDATGVFAVAFGHLVKIVAEPGEDLWVAWDVDAAGYGLATDHEGRVWLSEPPGLVAYSAVDGSVMDVVLVGDGGDEAADGHCNGVAIALDGLIAAGCADSGDLVGHHDPLTGDTWVTDLPPQADHPRGVAFDHAGHLYTINLNSGDVTRLDAVTGEATTFGGDVLSQPYGYSGDMTALAPCRLAGETTWTSPVLDVGDPSTRWLTIEWTATEPEGTSVTVRYRLGGAGPWVKVLSGMTIDAVAPTLEIRVELASTNPAAAATVHELAVVYEVE